MPIPGAPTALGRRCETLQPLRHIADQSVKHRQHLAEQLENAAGVDLFKALRPDSNGVSIDAEELWDEIAVDRAG